MSDVLSTVHQSIEVKVAAQLDSLLESTLPGREQA